MKNPTFAIKTLGCKVNQYEEQVLRENLLRSGFHEDGMLSANILIVNSCTVTEQADKKTIKLIRRAKRDNPAMKIFVTGCYAAVDKDIQKLRSLPEIFDVLALKDKMKLPRVLAASCAIHAKNTPIKEEISDFSSHTRAFLKIQDGCDQACSYCKVNIVRGRSRSKRESDILRELSGLVRRGYREIVLTGICLGSWKGNGARRLPDLLSRIDDIEGDFRIRLSSIEPNHIDARLMEVIFSSPRICPHLHIPLQSGSDRILRSMNRRYNTDQFRKLVRQLRRGAPLAGLTMDIIAAFPGENEEDFKQTLDFVRGIEPSRLHVFRYSDRNGTRSFDFDGKISLSVAKDRVEKLIEAGNKLQAEFCDKFIGKDIHVLIEGRSRASLLEGYSGEYVRARLEGFEGSEGEIKSVRVDRVDKSSCCVVASNPAIMHIVSPTKIYK